jgi:hypothetical protein
MKIDYPATLFALYPDAEWSLNGEDYEGLTWLDDSSKPTKKALEAAWPEVQHARAVEAVRIARYQAYAAPDGPDAIYMQYQRGDATEQDWLDAVQAVKDAHPYPEA